MVNFLPNDKILKRSKLKAITDKWLKLPNLSLTRSPIHHFKTVPNSNRLQMTNEMWLFKDFKIEIA